MASLRRARFGDMALALVLAELAARPAVNPSLCTFPASAPAQDPGPDGGNALAHDGEQDVGAVPPLAAASAAQRTT